MKIKTSELTGAELNLMVAKCLGIKGAHLHKGLQWPVPPHPDYVAVGLDMCGNQDVLDFINDWAQGGPLIERECITVAIGDWDVDQTPIVQTWSARSLVCEIHAATNDGWLCGPTPLIAAMRCFVASKLGDEVEVPDEL